MSEKNDEMRLINIYDNNIQSVWESNFGDLKKFIETIKIIKWRELVLWIMDVFAYKRFRLFKNLVD